VNRYLLDTHSFLWSIWQPNKLGPEAATVLENSETHVFVSSITFWEISLKHALGKLTLGCKPDELLNVAAEMGFVALDLTAQEAAWFYQLPKLAHKDPFDRMLIWQAISHNLVLISKDSQFSHYDKHGLQICW
jgi:PIN domain nuclease of toxin-antitoxin system